MSFDGTSIGWRQLGTGPAVVVVHGSLTTGEEWLPVAHALARNHTVMLVDRRGRGLSGDGQDYRLASEVADLRAVLAVAGSGASVVGHSYGAICAAAAGADISSLVLYEPPLPLAGPRDATALSRAMGPLARGDSHHALSIMLTEQLRVPDVTVARLRQSPAWSSMVAATPTFEREFHTINTLVDDLDRFTTIRQRTLLLIGADSPDRHVGVKDFLISRLRDAAVVEFPGERHYAHVSQPHEVARAIRLFLQPAGE